MAKGFGVFLRFGCLAKYVVMVGMEFVWHNELIMVDVIISQLERSLQA